ncbi:MAG: hypothetical protein QOD42_2675 [Sphingomonadales bacterium]|jgi:hypothetical protein|nr:hypothetical protein [Sphingomonadales bacterium]
MSAKALEQAKRDAVNARGRLEMTVADLQQRLRPGSLAGEAWDGVKGKSADLADGALKAVKKRPAAVSLALGAFALFLARAPIKRAVTRLVSKESDGIEEVAEELNAPAPKRARARTKEGVS